MSEVITTTPNRVKKNGFWCEDATAITQAAIDQNNLTWETEIPIIDIMRMVGLANGMLALGCARPRFQKRADRVTVSLMRYLHGRIRSLAAQCRPPMEVADKSHWLGDPNRVTSCKAEYDTWMKLTPNISDPAGKALAEATTILFSTEPPHIICIHALKLILFASMKLNGDEQAKKDRQGIFEFIEQELKK